MAQAGFFFDPDDENTDGVSCPFCLKSLTGWEESDDPLYVIFLKFTSFLTNFYNLVFFFVSDCFGFYVEFDKEK